MIATVVAVIGTLLGSIVTGTFQHLAAGRAERAAAAEQLRRDRLDAVTTLASAGSDHRRTLWMRGEARLRGADDVELEELRARSHITRSAITRPLVALRLLVPDPAVHACAKPWRRAAGSWPTGTPGWTTSARLRPHCQPRRTGTRRPSATRA
jgi:hypothetical protein